MSEAEKELLSSYMAAVYGCIGQMAFKEDGRQWNCDAFKVAMEHPVRQNPELLAEANKMLEATVGRDRRGRAVLEALEAEK